MDYFDLGHYSRSITTTSPSAQLWFNRGLIWLYAYNHEEAISCFEKALNNDPECAMAHWGIAYAIGPNYNKPWEAFEEKEKPNAVQIAKKSITQASALKNKGIPVEQALIQAISHRYPENPAVEDFAPWNDAYADAMGKVYQAFPKDLDVCSLFAEALMNRTPWQLWDLPSGQPALGASTPEALSVLETAFEQLEGAWEHPGLLHMYIHLMEMSPHPERALPHGDRLTTLVPDAGHLLHMATHIDVLCGDYVNVVSRNQRATQADKEFVEKIGADNFYTVYRLHNYHFTIYGAMFLGQPSVALTASQNLMAALPEDFLRPMADWFEGFLPMKQHALIRFGRWEDILAQPLPQDAELYCVTTAMMRYSRAIAFANLKLHAEAEAERVLFGQAYERVPESRMLFNNTCRDILQVAEQMMLGELAYHQGHYAKAFEYLHRSVALDDNLPYDEPWGWMQPTRHALGALLLEQGHYDEAEAIYRADLGLDKTLSRACQHPHNVWSLHGLYECLRHRGEMVEAAHIKLQLDKAIARAEVPIQASCYCRHKAAA
ncbi:tetratricopeptide repeat protein [Synechococcales cyanobacterium C]|uniref:Tetratricopeptide repeat protein n=1 Tax=Petrachloros mirabilis ULC683 TaxID=2781853 RepID=A0A8K1ZX44_9CYAN|nr:tetratricopeptide repeat protein [Petrachloros mirabilis]NCJ06870.1 tetratricopeptide repeat protein [Petrachloros mirabilis ULC683]